ncbi:MAG TPA: hypothetical protein VF173_05845 [Thermoanaerobaculia bacterium]|nr:hypothetical protein [Thermoanaerobaculia bacterium]
MERLPRTRRSPNPDIEGEALLSWGVVEVPVVSAWEAKKAKEEKEERRRLRLARKVAALALEVLGDGERHRIERETGLATERTLKAWRRRASYASTWNELVGGRLEGLKFVSYERLLQHAIDDPLECWCVLLSFTPSRNEERDYDRVRYGAPWVREAWHTLSGVVDELREHRRALVTCGSGRIAKGLVAAITEKRLGAMIYGPPKPKGQLERGRIDVAPNSGTHHQMTGDSR